MEAVLALLVTLDQTVDNSVPMVTMVLAVCRFVGVRMVQCVITVQDNVLAILDGKGQSATNVSLCLFVCLHVCLYIQLCVHGQLDEQWYLSCIELLPY